MNAIVTLVQPSQRKMMRAPQHPCISPEHQTGSLSLMLFVERSVYGLNNYPFKRKDTLYRKINACCSVGPVLLNPGVGKALKWQLLSPMLHVSFVFPERNKTALALPFRQIYSKHSTICYQGGLLWLRCPLRWIARPVINFVNQGS